MTEDPKHISQLDPTKRALVDQSIRNALLAIVAAQGRTVLIPLEDLDTVSETHRLVVVVDRGKGIVELKAEKAEIEFLAPPAEIVNLAEERREEREAIAEITGLDKLN